MESEEIMIESGTHINKKVQLRRIESGNYDGGMEAYIQ